MRRIVWVAVGAAGGIFAYRRAQQALADARERGVVLSAQQVGASAVGAVNSARALASSAVARTAQAPRQPGEAAARVLSRPPQSRPHQQGE
jgi:hypothetical protein